MLQIHKNEIDIFKNYLMIFMTIYEIRAKIFSKYQSLKSKFPLNPGSNQLEQENSFNISSIFSLI
jgi:hypothetical protein